MKEKFYGWWITVFAFFTFGIAVGIPYYGGPFFYDYYKKTFGWSTTEITLGFPVAALATLWVGPLLVHRFSPRKMIIIGTGLTALAFIGFGTMSGSLATYYALWFLYIGGYIFSGPIAHQVIVSHWFRKRRGKAMAVVYLGVGVFGGISAKFIAAPLTAAFDFRAALIAFGCLMFLAWPIALFLMKDKPSELGQVPDGERTIEDEKPAEPPKPFRELLRQPAFWLLTIGSFCSIGSIGSINQHMKLVFLEQGFTDQIQLNELFGNATLCILFSSIGGRIIMGALADKYNKKLVMAVTYVLVASTIPLLHLVTPQQPGFMYVFALLFGFGMGADYMLIPLMAADRFGVSSLARAMAVILPTDTIGQTWIPLLVSRIHDADGNYSSALTIVFVLAAVGATAILALPGSGKRDETLSVQDAQRAAAKR
ncbi:MAG: MFS transporter [Bryobacteraceae bacterium]|nr:MFS transporter [Bryobacteraceae bacterium]